MTIATADLPPHYTRELARTRQAATRQAAAKRRAAR
ncbi:MAG: hypothetical protein JWN32_239, partial [Solirubrobacterales bacterium]|nr:hypothetical protein [Solirubrobacterales bacterium]